jgi:hypothetical protein
MLPAEKLDLSVFVIVTPNVLPLSSSPEPIKDKPVSIPIGLPVTPSLPASHVNVDEPVTSIVPAFTADIVANDPHKADTPIFVNLFITLSILSLKC